MGWASIFKVAKGVATFVEVVDGVSDVAALGDEIAKAAMGDDYDPAFRDKAQEVADVGKAVDRQVMAVKRRQTDIDNLRTVIETLNLRLDLNEFQQSQAGLLTDKIAQFNLTFGAVPTAYTWFAGPAARTAANVDAESLIDSMHDVRAYAEQLKFSPLTAGLLSAGLGVRGLALAYRVSVKRQQARAAGTDIELQPVPNRQRRNAFSGMDMLPSNDRAAIKKLRKKVRISTAVDVFAKAGSAVSLGFTVVNILNRVNGRKAAFAAFEKQLVEYRTAAAAYRYVIEGHGAAASTEVEAAVRTLEKVRAEVSALPESTVSPDALEQRLAQAEIALQAALERNEAFSSAKRFFQTDDPNAPGEKIPWSISDDLSFAFGLDTVIAQHDAQCDDILASIRTLFEDMQEALAGASRFDTPEAKAVREYVRESDTIEQLAHDRARFDKLAEIAADKIAPTQERKDDGFDPIQETFDASLQKLMSEVIDETMERLRNVQLARQLLANAEQIVRDADREAERSARVATERFELVREILESTGQPHSDADVAKFLQGSDTSPGADRTFDRQAYIDRKARAATKSEWGASDFGQTPTTRFPDEESAYACLAFMLRDLESALAFHLVDRYVWLEETFSLPLTFRCSFTCNAPSCEFIPCFSATRSEWSGDNREALSWYLATHRHDFTFRTDLFGRFPSVTRATTGFDAEPGRRHDMRCEIDRTKATYWIDGKEYASATLESGDVPDRGHIGFAVSGTTDVNVEKIVVDAAPGTSRGGETTPSTTKGEKRKRKIPVT